MSVSGEKRSSTPGTPEEKLDGLATSANAEDLIVLSPDLNTAYKIPVKSIAPTDGSSNLLKSFEAFGVYNKNEFYLCTNSISRCCPHGKTCRDIHLVNGLTVADLKGTMTHRNFAEGEENDPVVAARVNSYPRHTAGQTLEVYDHRTRQAIPIDSGSVVITSGSEDYVRSLIMPGDDALGEGEGIPQEPRRMQQCTHFQKRLCLRGASCGFLHVLMYKMEDPPEKEKKVKKERKHRARSTENGAPSNVESKPASTLEAHEEIVMRAVPSASNDRTGGPRNRPRQNNNNYAATTLHSKGPGTGHRHNYPNGTASDKGHRRNPGETTILPHNVSYVVTTNNGMPWHGPADHHSHGNGNIVPPYGNYINQNGHVVSIASGHGTPGSVQFYLPPHLFD